jgi:UDP-N-acetyl-D-glucosamine dehydrogenase
MKSNLLKLIKKKKAVIGIVGLGYVGLPLAILFAKKGFKVFGFDIDSKKIQLINSNHSYIERIPSSEIKHILKQGKCFNTFENIKNCDAIIICVPTPLKKGNLPDLSYVKNTYLSIKRYLRFNQILILESTSYPGTTREEIINKLDKKFITGKNFFVGFSSERINPGYNENIISKIPKVVSGHTSACLSLVSIVYKSAFDKIVLAKSLEVAEFSKLLENIYRAVNIGFINEMKFIADKMELDIFEIIKIAKTKPFGFRSFNPGPGIGGHCIPVDPLYLYWKAKRKGVTANFIKLSAQTNERVIDFLKNKILKILKSKNIKKTYAKILILGVAYKKNVDDLRESASLKLIKKLLSNNFKKVEWTDPHIKRFISTRQLKFRKENTEITAKKLKIFDIVILMTDHDKFNYEMIYNNSKTIIDCRGRYLVDSKVIRG